MATQNQPKIGTRIAVIRSPRITRDLWDTIGTVEKYRENDEHFWVQFDEPTKSCGALMTGVWLPVELLDYEF